jgi:hypothetical protein
LDGETVSDFCRTVEYLQRRIADWTAVFTLRALAAGKLDPPKASAAFRTGDVLLLHAVIMLHRN